MRRVAEPDDEIPKINPSEVETLIKKIEQTTLSEQDKRMITRLLRTLLYVVRALDSGGSCSRLLWPETGIPGAEAFLQILI